MKTISFLISSVIGLTLLTACDEAEKSSKNTTTTAQPAAVEATVKAQDPAVDTKQDPAVDTKVAPAGEETAIQKDQDALEKAVEEAKSHADTLESGVKKLEKAATEVKQETEAVKTEVKNTL